MCFGCMARRFELGSVVSVFFENFSKPASMLILTSSNHLEKSCIMYDADTEDLSNKKEYVVTESGQVLIFWLQSLAEYSFWDLRKHLSEEAFDDFLQMSGVTFIKSPTDSFFDRYKGSTELALYYAVVRPINEEGLKVLTVCGFGEFQPGRWMMVLEGVWFVSEV